MNAVEQIHLDQAKTMVPLLESAGADEIHISGLVISDYSFNFSHWNADQSLSEWLKELNIPGIYGIDTRSLTKHLREKGAMLGKIVFDEDIPWYDPSHAIFFGALYAALGFIGLE